MTHILNSPPSVSNYKFKVAEQFFDVTDHEVASVKSSLGNRINANYEAGLERTPKQKEKLKLLIASALTVLVGLGLVIAGAVTTLTPLAFIAIPFGLVGVCLLAHGLSLGKDLDMSKDRSKIQQEIALRSFNEIAQQYNDQEIIGYKLLDGIAPEMVADPEKRAKLYLRFAKLRVYKAQVRKWKANEEHSVSAQWDRETVALRVWYNNEKAIINQQLMLIRQQEHMMHANTHYVESHRRRPATGLRMMNAVVSVSNTMTEWQLRDRKAQVRASYRLQMAPWDDWQSRSNLNIHTEYCRQEELIRQDYNAAKVVM